MVSVCSFLIGLPFGAAGVAIAYAISCLTLQMPIYYFMAGRSGPVDTASLWRHVLLQLPLLLAVVGTTFAAYRLLAASSSPVIQLCISVPAGFVAFAAVTTLYPPSRDVITGLIDLLREFRNDRT